MKIVNNRERIVNIQTKLTNDGRIKVYAEQSYEKIASMGILSGTLKSLRQEEEKKMIEHEREIIDKEKADLYKDKKVHSNGIKGYSGDYSKH